MLPYDFVLLSGINMYKKEELREENRSLGWITDRSETRKKILGRNNSLPQNRTCFEEVK